MSRSLSLAVVFAVWGCGSSAVEEDDPYAGFPPVPTCDVETRQDEYAANMEKTGDAGYMVRLVSSLPAPPAKGDNAWTVEVFDPGGAPVIETSSVLVSPWMPDHGHGTPRVARISGGEENRLGVDPVNLWMPGLWEIRVDIKDGDTQLDRVTYFFCVDG